MKTVSSVFSILESLKCGLWSLYTEVPWPVDSTAIAGVLLLVVSGIWGEVYSMAGRRWDGVQGTSGGHSWQRYQEEKEIEAGAKLLYHAHESLLLCPAEKDSR